jgi:pyrophosphatase PpaX
MIKAVIFDVDGVLIDSFEANLKFFQDLMIYAGYQPPTREQYLRMFHMNMMRVIQELVPDGTSEDHQRLWEMGRDRVVKHDSSLVKLPAGINEVIAELDKTFKLGIVTSRVKTGVFEHPELFKFKEYFKSVISYEDTDKHKPDPEPLLLAAQQLEVEPSECAYIGDTETDVVAAHAAGMKIVIYSDLQISGADACTANFKDIPKRIDEL